MTEGLKIIHKTKTDALLPRDASAIRRPSAAASSNARRPLGLGIAPGEIDEPERDRSSYGGTGRPFDYHGPEATAKELVAVSIAHLPAEAWDKPATMRDIFELGIGAALEAVFDGDDAILERLGGLKAKAAELQLENAQLKAQLGELRAKQSEHDFILSRLRVENAGPIGPQGLMGRDGHAGAPGPKGDRGERGDPGRPAPTITGWETDDSQFVAWPVFSNGVKATAGLHLRGMFETYHDQVDAADAAEEADAARGQREVVEREAEAVRQGRPARGP